jgi:hypothetical protein
MIWCRLLAALGAHLVFPPFDAYAQLLVRPELEQLKLGMSQTEVVRVLGEELRLKARVALILDPKELSVSDTANRVAPSVGTPPPPPPPPRLHGRLAFSSEGKLIAIHGAMRSGVRLPDAIRAYSSARFFPLPADSPLGFAEAGETQEIACLGGATTVLIASKDGLATSVTTRSSYESTSQARAARRICRNELR